MKTHAQSVMSSTGLIAVAVAAVMTTGIASAASPVRVSCALPYVQSGANGGCVGQNTVQFSTTNASANAKVTAELLGLTVNGDLIQSFTVKNGDHVQLGSKLSPTDWKFLQNGIPYEVYAPVPLLHVTVEDQGQEADAFCSIIPYIQMIQPTGGVVTEASGNNTNVLAAVPMTDINALHLYVDGFDLLAHVPNYQTCSAFAPCSGVVTINGDSVNYSNLIVDVASSISVPSSNTVQVTLNDLACGGHIFRVSSSKQPGFPKVSNSCDTDSLSKTATSSVFAISITEPTPLEIQPLIPTPVQGQVCSGTQITDVNINGKVLSVAGETHTVGNGTTTGDVFNVVINTTLDKTDLVRDAFTTHDAPLGTFDVGSNRLAASAKDVKGNRTYKNVIFATGNVAALGVDPSAKVFQSAALQHAVNANLGKAVQAKIDKALDAPATTDLANAFVLGLSASGAQTMFSSLCTSPIKGTGDPSLDGKTPGQVFSEKVTAAVKAIPLPSTTPSVPCSCDPTVNLTLAKIDIGTDVSCNVTFSDGYFDVVMNLPDLHIAVDALGWCEDDASPVCLDRTSIGEQATADVTGITFGFRVTEGALLGNTVCDNGSAPPCIPPNFFKGTLKTGVHDITNPDTGEAGINLDCITGTLCQVALDIITLGFGPDLTDIHLDFSKVQDFSGQIGQSQPDPVKLHQIQVDSGVVANFNQKSSGEISDIKIKPAGITAGLNGHFATLLVDPSVPPTPGITLTPAPIPVLPVPHAADIFVGISDDAINTMFAGLTAAGGFQTGDPHGNGCIDTGVTIGSILPGGPLGCDSLDLGNDVATVAARGYCHAVKGDVCSAITFNDPALSAGDNANLTAAEIGECFGAQGLPAGQTCSSIANGNLLTWGACTATPNFNLKAAMPLLFCAKGDVPPRMLLPDPSSVDPNSVPVVLRIPSLSVELVVDRTLDHKVPGALADIPGCFTQGASTAVDCNVFSSCLSLNLDFVMKSQTCVQDNKPGFVPTFQDVQIVNRQIGTVCKGGTSATSDTSILDQSSNDTITIPLGNNGAALAPPICGVGLDLGGFVKCTSPGILSIRTENTDPTSRDYLAITCAVTK